MKLKRKVIYHVAEGYDSDDRIKYYVMPCNLYGTIFLYFSKMCWSKEKYCRNIKDLINFLKKSYFTEAAAKRKADKMNRGV